MIKFQALAKQYGARVLFSSISREFGPGCHALQGPNGVGKSTLLKMLAGIERPDAGQIWLAGHALATEPRQAKQRLSYVPDDCPIYPFMRGRELLTLVAQVKGARGVDEVADLLHDFGVAAVLDAPFRGLSLGTQKKIMLAAAWLGDPSVILLDEPANGLDESARQVLAALLRRDAGRRSMLFSTHDVDFVAAAGAATIRFDALADGTPPAH